MFCYALGVSWKTPKTLSTYVVCDNDKTINYFKFLATLEDIPNITSHTCGNKYVKKWNPSGLQLGNQGIVPLITEAAIHNIQWPWPFQEISSQRHWNNPALESPRPFPALLMTQHLKAHVEATSSWWTICHTSQNQNANPFSISNS